MKPLPACLLAIITPLLFVQLNAQTVQWAHSGISPGFEYGNAITTDDSGNVYVSGQIEYTTHFDNGQNLSSYGSHDIFAGKYAPDGTVKWLRSAGGRAGDVGYGVGVDAFHNCYITGEIEDTAHFSNTDSLVAVASNDIFAAKYGLHGELIWTKSFGSAGNDKGYAMAVTSNGNCYITGYYSSDIYFDNIHLAPFNSGISDVYTLKLDANGTVLWAKKGGGQDADRGHAITYDRNENVYVAGYYTGSATFSGTTITTGSGVSSSFLARYDQTGHLDWINGNCCDSSVYNGVAVDENGNIYTVGRFYNSATFGTTTLNTSGDADIMLVKYDPSGNILWAKQAGGPYEDEAFGITMDSVNHILYITGQLDDHGYFDLHYAGAAGNRDAFVAAYDVNGNNLWVKPYGGVQRDIGYAITNDHNGYIFNTGIFNDYATFGNYNLTGDTLADYFINKINPTPASPPNSPATNLTLINSNCNDLQLSFNGGNGSGRLILAHAGSPVTQPPVSGSIYQASNVFGTGDVVGVDNFVIYNGNGASTIVTGLTGGVVYYFAVYEYSGSGGMTNYLTTNPALASHAAGSNAVYIQATHNSFCAGDSVTLTASGGTNYQWSPSNGLSSTTGSVVFAFPTSSTTYSVTADNNGCPIQNTISLTVNPVPTVSFSLNDSICVNGTPVILTGGSPSGGTYNGIGVLLGIFNPAPAGPGPETLTYSYYDGNGCGNAATSVMTVLPAPSVSLGNDTTLCAGNSIVLHAGGGQPSYHWSTGSTNSSITVDSSGTGFGTKTVYVTVGNNVGCNRTDTIRITFSVCAGIETANRNPLLHLYPNPFSETLYLHLDQKAAINIIDVTGRLVENLPDLTGNVSFGENLSTGVYTVIVLQKDMKTVFRVVKNTGN